MPHHTPRCNAALTSSDGCGRLDRYAAGFRTGDSHDLGRRVSSMRVHARRSFAFAGAPAPALVIGLAVLLPPSAPLSSCCATVVVGLADRRFEQRSPLVSAVADGQMGWAFARLWAAIAWFWHLVVQLWDRRCRCRARGLAAPASAIDTAATAAGYRRSDLTGFLYWSLIIAPAFEQNTHGWRCCWRSSAPRAGAGDSGARPRRGRRTREPVSISVWPWRVLGLSGLIGWASSPQGLHTGAGASGRCCRSGFAAWAAQPPVFARESRSAGVGRASFVTGPLVRRIRSCRWSVLAALPDAGWCASIGCAPRDRGALSAAPGDHDSVAGGAARCRASEPGRPPARHGRHEGGQAIVIRQNRINAPGAFCRACGARDVELLAQRVDRAIRLQLPTESLRASGIRSTRRQSGDGSVSGRLRRYSAGQWRRSDHPHRRRRARHDRRSATARASRPQRADVGDR